MLMKMMLISLLMLGVSVGTVNVNAAAVDKTASAADATYGYYGSPHPKTTPTKRALITKYEDVAYRVGSPAARHFDIEAEADEDLVANNGYSTLMLHLDKMEPAVTSQTSIKFNPTRKFNAESVNDLAILGSNPGKTGGEFTVMSVNTQSGDVRGLQRGANGDTRQISIGSEVYVQRPKLRARPMSHLARKFSCGVDHTDDHHHDHEHEHERTLSLFEGHPKDNGEDYHQHKSLFLSPDEAQRHIHDRGFTRTTTDDIYGNANTTDTTSGNANHEGFIIDLIVAIDAEFIIRQGSTEAAVEYINFLVAAANVIYEEELDVHLNVVGIEETDIFESEDIKTLRDGLRTMRHHYKGTMGSDGVNLVHAMLGKDMGGGIAFIDTVCDSSWGVGLSSGLRGIMDDLDEEAMHDAHMFAHEIGHSLGSDHTFDGYNPPVDTCGIECPEELPIQASATLMSYCNFCQGGFSNVALTLGGSWNGEGSRLDINAWNTNPGLAVSSVSEDPERVNHYIWTALSAKGGCIRSARTVSPSKSPTAYPTQDDLPTPTSDPLLSPTQDPLTDSLTFTQVLLSIPNTSYPTATPNTSSPSKSPTFFPEPPQDGRHWVHPETHCMQDMSCLSSGGIMFDLELMEEPSSYGIIVESMLFEHLQQNQTVDLYTVEGSYSDREQLGDQWSKVATVSVNETNAYTEFVLDTPIIISPGNKQGFYLVTSDRRSFFLVGTAATTNYSSSSTDVNGVSFQGGSVVFDMFGVSVAGYHPTVQAGYTMVLPPSAQPTVPPTQPPSQSPTVNPTPSPTVPPTQPPTQSPTVNPTQSPSVPPSQTPTRSPTVNPTPSPTVSPSQTPMRSPTVKPTQPLTQSPTSSPIILDHGIFSTPTIQAEYTKLDQGPFTITPDHLCTKDCFVAPGFMLDITNKNQSTTANSDIIITGLSFEHIAPKKHRIVDLYRTAGSYTGREQDPEKWIKIASLKAPRVKFHYGEFVLDPPITLPKGETVGFYIQTEESILLVGKNRQKNDEQFSDGKVQLDCGSAIMNGGFGAPFEGYSWNGSVQYSTATTSSSLEPVPQLRPITSPSAVISAPVYPPQ